MFGKWKRTNTHSTRCNHFKLNNQWGKKAKVNEILLFARRKQNCWIESLPPSDEVQAGSHTLR